MATRREMVMGGISLVALTACGHPPPVTTGDSGGTTGGPGTSGGTGTPGGTATDTQTGPKDSGTPPPPVCEEESTAQQVVLCLDEPQHSGLGEVGGSELIESSVGKLVVVRTSDLGAVTCSAIC